MKTLGRILALCVLLLALIPLPADGAGVVTDTLTVKVGYYGMAADKYVEAGTYHWTELMDNLPLHIQTGDAWDYAVEVEPMLALVVHWNVDITASGGQAQGNTGENGSVLVDKDHAVTMTDAETGTYYIVRDSRSSGGSR